MTPEVRELVEVARQIQGEFPLTDDLTAGSVGAALRTGSGKIFTGICIDVTCGLGICAERSAVAEMLKTRETAIDLIVAVGDTSILTPCGCCRELLLQIDRRNLETRVVVAPQHIVLLRELLPDHWLVT